ncbi:MAG: FKBP-type peptidyl-prolyl cis-trans isomerase [Saprospiraceae bacterium]
MSNFKTFLILLFIGVTLSCNQNKTTKAGSFDLNFYSKSDGLKPISGQYAYFQMDILNDKKELLQSYRNQKRMPSIKIPEANSPVFAKNPIPDALRQMAINDSVGIIIPRDSVPGLSGRYEEMVYLEYVLVLKEIMNEDEYQNRLARERQAEIDLMSANKAKLPEVKNLAEKTIAEVKSGKIKPVMTESGLSYFIHEMGTGEMATNDRMISAQYYGALQTNGKTFDTSFNKGRAYSFRLGSGSVIKGWDVGFLNFKVGTKASIFIPSEMGYGANGSPPSIPPNADLYFYVELEDMFY